MKKLILLFLLILSTNTFASFFFFEPAIGYYQGHYRTMKATGFGTDFKTGINWGGMYIGADLAYAPSLTLATIPSGASYDATMMNKGIVLGWKESSFRIWYTYYTIGADMSWKVGANEYEVSGDGHKIGLGVKVFNNVSFNIEVLYLTYDTYSVNGTSSEVNYYMDLGFFSLSWPF